MIIYNETHAFTDKNLQENSVSSFLIHSKSILSSFYHMLKNSSCVYRGYVATFNCLSSLWRGRVGSDIE